MRIYPTGRLTPRQTTGEPFQTDHSEKTANATSEAVDSDTSAGESDAGDEIMMPGPEDIDLENPEVCTCGFCDGVEIETESIDPRTGTVERNSFTRKSRHPRCPNCGGKNIEYRDSYTAHAADVARREGRTRNAYFVTLVLDREAADKAGVDGEDSYQVLTGQRGVWTRSRRAVKRRDGDAVYLGTLSSRPSDGRWHVHVLVFTSLSRHELERALHVTGADAYVSAPDGESHEQFGARKGAYAFDNAANSPSARFISSRGGVGYDSNAAVQRRKEAVEDGEETEREAADTGTDTHARCLRRNQQRQPGETNDETRPETVGDRAEESSSIGETDERAPPVQCDGESYSSLDAYLGAVKAKLTRRVGGRVHVTGLGDADLLKVATNRAGDGLTCTVYPDVGEGTVKVAWPEISARDVPTIRRCLTNSQTAETDPMNGTTTEDTETEDDPVERFYEAARYSTVTTELPDGRRRVTIKDHETGQYHEQIKPPRRRE